MQIYQISKSLNKIFKLKNKPRIFLKNRIRFYGDKNYECFGFYSANNQDYKPWDIIHNIRIEKHLSEIEIYTTLIHEYVHAWQTENVWCKYKRRVTIDDLEHNQKAGFIPWVDYFKKTENIDIINMSSNK